MAKPIVDISIFGDKQLMRQMAKLEGAAQKRIVRKALRASSKRLKDATVAKVQSGFFKEATGTLAGALKATPVKPARRSRGRIGTMWAAPERSLLGIDPKDKYYYPWAVEYGHDNVPPKSFIRSTVNENERREFDQQRRDIVKGVSAEWAKAKAKR